MKKFIFFLLIPLAFACSGDSFNNKNPYIPNYGFSVQMDMNLPSYSQLQFPSNGIYFGGQGAGARGLIVFNTGSGYRAYDAACPNQELSSCSTMHISGINAICECDDAQYNLFTGQSQGLQYPMKQYRVQQNGTVLSIYN